MKTENRRTVLLTGARLTAVAALGALAATLGLRRGAKGARASGYCDRAGRCGGCPITHDCDAYQALLPGSRP